MIGSTSRMQRLWFACRGARMPRRPSTPRRSRLRRIEGDVCVKVSIDTSGRPTLLEIVKASPFPEFVAAVGAAVATEEFTPAMTKDGVAVPSRLTYCYHFRVPP
jgi:TonB family protein